MNAVELWKASQVTTTKTPWRQTKVWKVCGVRGNTLGSTKSLRQAF